MNNIDRFIRVFYKEANLFELAIWPENDQTIEELLSGRFKLAAPKSVGETNTPTDRYWLSVIERYLRLYHNNHSEDEANLLLKNVYSKIKNMFHRLNPVSSESNLVDTLYSFFYITQEMFHIEDDELKVDLDMYLDWNGLMNKIDTGVYFGAFAALFNIDIKHGFDYARLSDSRLDHILAKGYSDNHMHLNGSGYSAEMNWHILIHNSDLERGELFKRLDQIVQRNWDHLCLTEQEKIALVFTKIPIIRNLIIASIYQQINPEYRCLTKSNELLHEVFLIKDDLSLMQFIKTENYSIIEETLKLIVPELSKYKINDSDDLLTENPASFLYEEQLFIKLAFRALLDQKLSPIATFATNVYISAMTQFKFCLIQDNFTMGFRRFKKAEDQKDIFIDLCPNGKQILYETVFYKYYAEKNVRQIELRIAPKNKAAIVKLIRKLRKANKEVYSIFKKQGKESPKKIKFGLIVHFIKDGKPETLDKGRARKEDLFETTCNTFNEFIKFFDLYDNKNKYLRKVVAIDAANYETGTPPEMYGPIFREFASTVKPITQVGLTYHAGEDFDTLCNGIRAIDDALEFLELKEGDRIGHATALGLDADRYYFNKRNYITTTLQEHVDNLAWLYNCFISCSPNRSDVLLYLNREFDKYAGILFNNDDFVSNNKYSFEKSLPPINIYSESYKLRGNNPEIYIASNTFSPVSFNNLASVSRSASYLEMAQNLYLKYQYCEKYKEMGASIQIIRVDDLYIEAIKISQNHLRQKIASRGISIETSPSSNRKISSVDKYIDLQTIRLNQHGLTIPSKFDSSTCNYDVPLTINTDDSGIFQTNLASEYGYIIAALKQEEFKSEEIYNHIDYLRELSLTQSFL